MRRSLGLVFSLPMILAAASVCPGQVVINEVLYDGPGTDAGMFTELAGPGGMSLDGWTLVGINGSGGVEYDTIDLTGNSIPMDGLFVVAQDMTVPNADFISTSVDWQNGPDQVVLRNGGVDVDSLCYGDDPDLSCEGTAAPDVPNGSSLTRDENNTDTDDNAADFMQDPNPTPGQNFGGVCDGVSGLTCDTVDCNSMDVFLTWTNNDTYSGIDIFRSGDPVAAGLPGTTTSFTDPGVPTGLYDYTVVATCTNGITAETMCSLQHCPPAAADPSLLITEIVDGTLPGGRPKFVELTNCGTNTIDLSFYSIGNFNNGTPELGGGSSTLLSGMLGPDEQYIFEYDTMADTRFEEVYGFPPDQFAGGGFVNGDDVIALFFGPASTDGMGTLTGMILDIYGVIGVDGTGEAWEYTDGYARRDGGATQTDTFDPMQWIFGGVDVLEGSDPGEADEILLLQTLTAPGAHDCVGSGQCVAPSDVMCDSDCGNNDVMVSWTNNDTYTSIDILIDGAPIATLAGTDTMFLDAGRPSGIYTYSVVGNCTGASGADSCTITHCPPSAGNLMITELCDGTLAGGRPRWVELTNCDTVPIDTQFYSVGNFNNGSLELGGGSSTGLLSVVLNPGDQYIFEYDTMADSRFEEVYGFASDQFAGGGFINGNDVVALFFGPASTDGMGTLDGTIVDVYGVIGQDGVDEAWEYTDGYARRNPMNTATDVFDETQWLFGGVDSLEGIDPMVETDEIMLLQMLTEPGMHDCGLGPMFPDIFHGDFNGDGSFNGLTDGLGALNFQFSGGTPPPCAAQSDFNEDGSFNGLTDGLGMLNFQFSGGPPPPSGAACAPNNGAFDMALGCDTPNCP